MIISLIGSFMVGVGTFILLSPTESKQLISRAVNPTFFAITSVIRIMIGILFILAAKHTLSPLFIKAIGAVFLVAGILIPIAGLEKVTQWRDQWVNQPDTRFRIFALVFIGLGLSILRAVA